MLIDQSGQEKGVLKRGEHNSLQTDRVILVPGPDAEVEIVKWIYRMFTQEGKREREIASVLNSNGVQNELGRPWTRGMVHQILVNEKYIGNNVYNRVSFKLKKKRVINPPEMLVRADDVFEPIVDPQSFFVARGMIQERNRTFSDAEMIDLLAAVHGKHQRLSAYLIDDADGLPSSSAYRNRFGSLLEAYKRAGFTPERDYEFLHINRRIREMYPGIVSGTIQQLNGAGAHVTHDDASDHIRVNGEFTVAIVMTRCRSTPGGSLRWLITLEQEAMPDITVVVRMDAVNEEPADYYLLPRIDLDVPSLRLKESNGARWDTYRFASLNYFCGLTTRVKIEVAA
jgi:hypothetical protein